MNTPRERAGFGAPPKKKEAPVLEVDPLKAPDSIEQEPVARKRGRPPKEAAESATPAPPKKVVSRGEVMGMICTTMGLCSTLLDESFNPFEFKRGLDGQIAVTPLPHVEQAVTDMMPWVEIYGADLIKMLPWFGLASGIMGLCLPAVDPICEIAAGIRKPRCTRKGPDDIYTDAAKAVGYPGKPAGARNGKKAADATVSVDAVKAEETKA